VFIIVFENQGSIAVTQDPHFSHYANLGITLPKHQAATHPSQPNYWAMVAGDTFNTTNANIDLDASHVGDLMDAKGISWKTYQEGYPGNCFTNQTHYRYVRKHNPFISFLNMQMNETRCNLHIVDARQLDIDLANQTLPQFSFYTPDLDNDGHDTGIAFAGRFVRNFLELRLPKFPNRTLVVITWDEDDYKDANEVLTILLSKDLLPSKYEDITPYTHYSLLRTIEENWGLDSLNKSDWNASLISEENFRPLLASGSKCLQPFLGIVAIFLMSGR
jgi:hypothetical protein